MHFCGNNELVSGPGGGGVGWGGGCTGVALFFKVASKGKKRGFAI